MMIPFPCFRQKRVQKPLRFYIGDGKGSWIAKALTKGQAARRLEKLKANGKPALVGAANQSQVDKAQSEVERMTRNLARLVVP